MSNNILIAEQNDCDVALVDGAKVFRYKDGDGNIQTVDIAGITDGTSLFENNQNIDVDWEVDLPNLTNATNMFKDSSIISWRTEVYKSYYNESMFQDCKNLSSVNFGTLHATVKNPIFNNTFNGCTNLSSFKISVLVSGRVSNVYFNGMFDGCNKLKTVSIDAKGSSTSGFELNFTNMFKNCTQLENIVLNINLFLRATSVTAAGMFDGCLLGPEQLQQILDWPYHPFRALTDITIGVDSTKVTQSDIDNGWNSKFSAKNWNVTWQLNTPE